MTQLTLPQAAKATGKDRTTLYRAIKAGKLSATKNHAGDYQVDVAELVRVYGPLKLRSVASQPRATAENANCNNDLSQDVALLRARNAALEADKRELQADKDDLRQDRDKWRQAYEDQAATVKLLTDQRAGPKSLLARIFSR